MKTGTSWIVVGILFLAVWLIGWSLVGYHYFKRDFADSPGTGSATLDYTVRFGIIKTDADGNEFLSDETSTIPLRYKDSGFRYGIEIVPPDDESFSYYCVFHFSAAPKIISGEGFFDQSAPSAMMRTIVTTIRGTIVEENWFDPGDPTGDESVDVYVNDKLVKTIKYTVVPQ